MTSVKFTKRRSLWAVFAYVYCTLVLAIVNGQSTTDDDGDKDQVIKLTDIVAELRAELNNVKSQLAERKCTPTDEEQQRGASYIRWGRKTCGNATLLYKGYASGPQYNKGGSGSNLLCLPEEPQWKTYINGYSILSGGIAGVKYEIFNSGFDRENSVFSERNSGGIPLGEQPASCAVCYVQGRSTVLMIPARTECPDGWTTEYAGYLVSDDAHHASRKRSSYVCLDEAPEIAVGGTSTDQAVIYPVEVTCGTLPCSLYISGRELTCVVCSK